MSFRVHESLVYRPYDLCLCSDAHSGQRTPNDMHAVYDGIIDLKRESMGGSSALGCNVGTYPSGRSRIALR
jgi:hypothetical protein